MKVIDMHTHIFPDKIAAKATVATAEYFDLPEPPNHYGSVSELVDVLRRAGINYAMVFSAATTEHQVEHINRYICSEAEVNSHFLPCGTIHAGYEHYREELGWMREHGIPGVKLHLLGGGDEDVGVVAGVGLRGLVGAGVNVGQQDLALGVGTVLAQGNGVLEHLKDHAAHGLTALAVKFPP